jgi:hypothetical protein
VKKNILIIYIFIITFPIFARNVTITVTDAEIDLPLEGAVIHSWDEESFICDTEGKAVITVPDDRQVTVYATYPGYDSGRITIPVTGEYFSIDLRLSGVMYARELVVEASRPGSNESRIGRSVAVGEKEIAQTGEIGIIEDVMSTIKLLPGVNYSGFFSSMPSIRGGHPGDMIAALDGFYINNPYHWGGGFSIFDPRMVQSAKLSHGVFSSRYGNTISGLLEISTKKPSVTEIEFELGANMSAANLSFSFPLSGKGGILLLGRVTYYDPFIAFAKQLSKVITELEVVNSVKRAPFIRAGAVNGNYRFSDSLELAATAFWGMDGVGVKYQNSNRTSGLESDTEMEFDFTNYQGFLTSYLSWNPRDDMLLKFSAGTGYENAKIDGKMLYNIHNKEFSQNFRNTFPQLTSFIDNSYQYKQDAIIKQSEFTFNLQGRIDYDWEISEHFIAAAGLQEMFNRYRSSGEQQMLYDRSFASLGTSDQENIISAFPLALAVSDYLRVGFPVTYSPDSSNRLFSTSAYILGEYTSTDNRFQTELGLRIDHFLLLGDGFTLRSDPVLNPRVNFDFNILKNYSLIRSLDISVGTGLFSSVNSAVFNAEERFNIDYMKPNRSWTSILGIKFEFPQKISFTVEGYYKYVFNRMYIPIGIGLDDIDVSPSFDGTGKVWGVDFMLQRKESSFFDGWLTYSWNWAKYRDPDGRYGAMGISGGNSGDDWYFPSYHRFHNLNLIMNIKPLQTINFYIRFGLASGVLLSKRIGDGPFSYPVLIYDKDNPSGSYFIEKYYWPSVSDESNRTTPSMPMDVKFSIFGTTKKKSRKYEVYVAVENVLSLLYTSQGNTSFNSYTGQVDTGSNSARYDIPIPIPSFGFKISY